MLRVLDGEATSVPPIWLMRQAGRYLPEYRVLRSKAASFLEFCYSPALAAEATLQPIRRFGFDAAILFSDILVVPDAFGQKVSFESGSGPRLSPIDNREDFRRLRETIDLAHLDPVFETIGIVKSALPADVALIGFCGAPWTVASYMIAGQGTPDQAPARLFAYREPALFQELIDRLVAGSIDYLARQIAAGVELVQIFDSWAGVLPPAEFEHWCLEPIRAVIAGLKVRCPAAKVIAFPRGAGSHLMDFAVRTGADAVSLDTSVDLTWAADRIASDVVLQGNLDPLALVAGGDSLRKSIAGITGTLRGRPYIFNLGHGILPETPITHVEALLRQIRSQA
ncbi:MAG: uroporphyrinogen decarboxylase [Beijerinckiaceae bacterium]|nr:MAG: uroporphyrinogen decarboxylase [Beijerinckiaceae bacterium]